MLEKYDVEIPIESKQKWRNVSFLALAELLAMALWFSASAVIPQLSSEWGLTSAQSAWLTMSLQVGFVAGALVSAGLNLADRIESRYILSAGALGGAIFNFLIAFLNPGLSYSLFLRFLTGACLALVYPPGMKLIATWCKEDRGVGIGLLIAALTFGTALPHLVNAVPLLGDRGMPPWRVVLYTSSAMAVMASFIAVYFVHPGPFLSKMAPFNWQFIVQPFLHKPTRLANFGYLGHMWELYAMWAWVPILLIDSYEKVGWSIDAARVAGFGSIAAGAVGAILAGLMSDRVGRTAIAIWSLLISGACALIGGFLISHPGFLTILCLIWGIAVVADSGQFSTAVTELTDTRYVGTALTIQTSVGFLLTLVTIQIIPPLVDIVGWRWVFTILAIGPAFGIWSMVRLRTLPESLNMASGNR